MTVQRDRRDLRFVVPNTFVTTWSRAELHGWHIITRLLESFVPPRFSGWMCSTVIEEEVHNSWQVGQRSCFADEFRNEALLERLAGASFDRRKASIRRIGLAYRCRNSFTQSPPRCNFFVSRFPSVPRCCSKRSRQRSRSRSKSFVLRPCLPKVGPRTGSLRCFPDFRQEPPPHPGRPFP